MPYCEVEPGVRLYYEEFGEGQPLLFIHGGGMSHEMWEQQVYELADHFRVVSLDLRGHGESDKPPRGHTVARLTADVDALATLLGLDGVTVIAHGVSGYIGILLALRRADRVSRLVLVNTGVRLTGKDEERGGFSAELWDSYSKGIAKNKIEAVTKLVDQTFFYRDPGQATRQATANVILQWPLYAKKMLNRDMMGMHLEEKLEEIRVPTLVLHGVHDRKQRYSGAEYLTGKIPGARLVAFDESAHNPQLEEPEKFNKVLMDFVISNN